MKILFRNNFIIPLFFLKIQLLTDLTNYNTPYNINCPTSGTVRACAAQPRQVWKEAAVSECLLRRGAPDAGHFYHGFIPLSHLSIKCYI